jgi:type I restriction enzyme S subunit
MTMAKRDISKVTPRLRFPEFREANGWESLCLNDLADVVRGGSPRPIDAYITTEPEGLNWLKIGDVSKDSKYVIGTEQKVLRTALSKTREILPGDFILSNSMSFGRPYLTMIRACIHDGWIAVTSLAAAFNRDFMYYSMMSEASQTYFENQAAGSGVRNLNVDIVKLLPVCMPASNEQQKIADCLTSLDEVIAAQGRFVAALKTHKRGLMQQLFPREGETRPRLRFPEFHNAPEWGEKSLDSYFSHVRNGFVGTATPFYVDNGGVSYLQGKNVKKGLIDPAGLIKITESFHEKQKKSHLRVGDIVMVQSGHVGECAHISDEYAGANCHALIIMTPRDCQHSPFFVHCFGSDYGKRLIAEITTGNTIKHILASDMKELAVCVPQFAEQQRIADCLASLDTQIAAESNQLAALKTHKQGLMQQLFPAPEGAAA